MSILLYDPFAGISGDMHIGAMVDAGVPPEHLIHALKTLNLTGWRLSFTQEQRSGITATRAHVETDDEPARYETESHHGEHHHHGDDGEHTHHKNHKASHHHRTLTDILEIVHASSLSEQVKHLAEAMFSKVAEAEAKVHGRRIDEVHFHEVGAIDSIIDIVAAAVAIDYLKPEKIISFPPQLGGGYVRCAHGTMPVPAPATAEILRGIPVRSGAVDFEATTPTGAAILAAVVDEFVTQTDVVIHTMGYGAGSRDAEVPNVLRVCLAEEGTGSTGEEVIRMETVIDDMNPELFGAVCERLRAAGAKDVWTSAVSMKKGRPGTLLSMMASRSKEQELQDLLFRETTTAGVHSWVVDQSALERDYIEKETAYGTVRIKRFYWKGEMVTRKAEYEDVRRLAEKHHIPLRRMYEELEL
ncbi:MAG: nickel pincer cofactor biosynthesis protein LarC [Spirochaetota bacterium]